ncbi:hypothetical protein P8452_74233 [Trifolium repens]|nr:hypothetical protein P8452_74233 [Trifolium repens]
MTGGTPNHGTGSGPGMTLTEAVTELRRLQDKVTTMDQEKANKEYDQDEDEINDSQPLSQILWDARVPENFKTPHLPAFDGKTDPSEHLMAVGTQTAIIGAADHLKCKLLSGTLKEAALRWYMNLPKNSIESWTDFQRKFIQQFSGSKHIKVTATSLFTIRQNPAETLREYLARFCEATIKISNPNQEMFVAAFHNGLKAGHFNESLAQKPATSMQEIIKRAECYIKGEENNAEKRSRDAREREPPNRSHKGPDFYSQRRRQPDHRGQEPHRKPYHQQGRQDMVRFPEKEYTPLNRACKGHDTEKCFRLRDLIEELIKSGHLRKFLEDAADGKVVVPKVRRDTQGNQEENPEGEKVRIAVNTIARGFAGGGESSNARKRYVRRSVFEAKFVGHTSISPTPDLSFTKEDKQNFNTLEAAMSTLYLSIKYPLDDGRVGTIKGDQAMARRCYESSLKIKHKATNPYHHDYHRNRQVTVHHHHVGSGGGKKKPPRSWGIHDRGH